MHDLLFGILNQDRFEWQFRWGCAKKEFVMPRTDSEYDQYFDNLIKGRRTPCAEIVDSLIASDFDVNKIYLEYFQKGLYQVGRLWEQNKVSVATEHLATSITENLMNKVYEKIPIAESIHKTVVVTSIENESHQVGGKMVADFFEMQGWDPIYLGGDTPALELVDFVEEIKPDLIGLSISVFFHMDTLVKTVALLNKNFKSLPIIIGGQAFQWGGHSIIDRFQNTSLVLNLDDLKMAATNISKGNVHS